MRLGLTRLLGTVVLGLMLAIWLATPAGAHTGVQSYVYLDVTEESLSGRLDIPIVDLEEALDIELGQRGDVLQNASDNRDVIIAYLDAHFDIGDVAATWHVDFHEIDLLGLEGEADSNYLLFPFTVTVEATVVPRVLDVTFDPFFDDVGRTDALLLSDAVERTGLSGERAQRAVRNWMVGRDHPRCKRADIDKMAQTVGCRGKDLVKFTSEVRWHRGSPKKAAILARLRIARAVASDETGVRIEGVNAQHWVFRAPGVVLH